MEKTRLETLDIFRGCAILLVALYHYTARLPASALNMETAPSPAFHFGWIGVYFFFVLSGYCIFLTLERAKTIKLFLARRFSRIYPAYLAALIGLFVFGAFVALPSVPAANYREAMPGVTDVLLNMFLAGELGEWVNGSFWSIAVEVKFYVLVAILAGLFGTGHRLIKNFTVLSALLATVWIAASLFLPTSNRINAASVLTLVTIAPYLPFFAFGMLARYRQTSQTDMREWLGPTGFMMLIVLILKTGASHLDLMLFITSLTGVLVSFSALLWLFVRFVDGKHLPHIPVLSRSIAAMGFLSYSWYLLHEPIGFWLMTIFGSFTLPWLNVLIALVGTYALAWIFAQLVEWRFRKPFENFALSILTVLFNFLPSKTVKSKTEE